MKLMFVSEEDRAEPWRDQLLAEFPKMEFFVWPEDANRIDLGLINYTLAWKPPVGVLRNLTGLKFVQSLGAGVDGLLLDPSLPRHIPISRMVDRSLIQGMTEYILYNVIHYHRKMGDYAFQQNTKTWRALYQVDPRERRIGLMGLGQLGSDAAEKLLPLEFDVASWTRSPKKMAGVSNFHGPDGLIDFLARTEILICLLPLTSATHGIINSTNLANLPRGAIVINCARGGHVVDEDLLAALDTDQIAGACLDVFNEEPLPKDHPYWTHPKVRITPHTASLTAAHSAVKYVIENILRVERGELPLNIVNLEDGY